MRLPHCQYSNLACCWNELLDKFVTTHIRSTSHLVEILSEMVMDDEQAFATLDIVNLYGSIPLEDDIFSELSQL